MKNFKIISGLLISVLILGGCASNQQETTNTSVTAETTWEDSTEYFTYSDLSLSVITDLNRDESHGDDFFNSLSSLYINDDVTEIRFNQELPALSEIHLPDSLIFLGNGVLANSPNLTELELPDSLQVLEGLNFWGDTGLTSIVLPKDLVFLGADCFKNSGITDIYIPYETELVTWPVYIDVETQVSTPTTFNNPNVDEIRVYVVENSWADLYFYNFVDQNDTKVQKMYWEGNE